MKMQGRKAMRIKLFVAALACLFVLAGCSQTTLAPVTPPVGGEAWQIPFDVETDSERIFQENIHLFDYDQNAPLDIQDVRSWQDDALGVTFREITYASPKGGRVPATLILPNGSGPFAGLIIQHGMPANRQGVLLYGAAYARLGAVVIAIDAPFARPENENRAPLTLTEQDHKDQIQLIVDLRRAVDLLVARPDVDPDRLAYVGISYGGAMGGLFAGVETRLKAYALVVGDGGLVTHVVSAESQDSEFYQLPEEEQRRWIEAMWPIEPIHYVGHAAPAALLFENGTQDQMVPPANAYQYQMAGSEPKTIQWYESGHGLPVAHMRDEIAWLQRYIKISNIIPPDNLILMDPVEDMIVLLPQIRRPALVIDRLLLVWFLLVAGSMVYVIWDLWRSVSTPWGVKVIWLLVAFFYGPLGLLIYFVSYRRAVLAIQPGTAITVRWRALGATVWSVSGIFVGGAAVLATIKALPFVFGDPLTSVPLAVILPLLTGWAASQIVQWGSRREATSPLKFHRPFLADLISTNMALAGGYPAVLIPISYWLDQWYRGAWNMASPPIWAIISLGALAGAITAYAAHVWMMRHGIVIWGVPSSTRDTPDIHEQTKMELPWLKVLGAILLSYTFLFVGIGLSLVVTQ